MPITKITIQQKPFLAWNAENEQSIVPNGLQLAGPELMKQAKQLTHVSLLALFVDENPNEVQTADQLDGILNVFFGSKDYTITRHEYTNKKRTFTVGMLTITQEDI